MNGISISIDDLRNNDKKILVLLSEEVWSTYSFKTLKENLVFISRAFQGH